MWVHYLCADLLLLSVSGKLNRTVSLKRSKTFRLFSGTDNKCHY